MPANSSILRLSTLKSIVLVLLLCAALVRCGGGEGGTDPVEEPVLAASPTAVEFKADAGGGNPAAKTVSINNSGPGTLSGLSVSITYGAGQTGGWLTASLSSTTAPSTLSLSAVTGSLPAGSYQAEVRVSSSTATNGPRMLSVTFDVMLTPPMAPSQLAATVVSTFDIDLTWTDNAQNETGFRIERCAGAGCTTFTEIATVPANITSYRNTGLQSATSYSYRVRAYNIAGNSAYSNVASATTAALPPTAPSGLTATAVSASRIDLAWTDHATNESGFRIERCAGAGCSNFQEVATVGANVQTYQSTGLSPATSYTYRVRAYGDGGTSPYSSTASAVTHEAVPAAPDITGATATSASAITINWRDNSTNETGFRIERCTGTGCSSFALVATVGPNVTAYQSTGLAAATTYRFRVQAYNGAGSSAYSNIVQVTTHTVSAPPAAPTQLVAVATSGSQINIAWTDNSSDEHGFRIERCTGAGCSSWVEIAVVGANVTSHLNSGLMSGTTYGYRVRAYNTGGNSAYSNTATATTPAPALTNLQASGASGNPLTTSPTTVPAGGSTTLSSRTVRNTSSTASGAFDVGLYLSTDAVLTASDTRLGGTTNAGLSAGASLTYGTATVTIPLSTPPGTYYVGMLVDGPNSVNETNENDNYVSTPITVTAALTPPTAPSGLVATAVSSSRIDLSWTDNSTNESEFRIERCTGASCTNFVEIALVGANDRTYQNTGLSGATTYRYRVRAYNTAGASGYTAIATATTPSTLAAPVLGGPSVSGSSVTLTWTFTWPGLASSNDRYSLEQSTSPSSGFVEVFSSTSRQSPFTTTRTNLAPGTYYFRVRALTSEGFSPYSEVRSATVSAQPMELTAYATEDNTLIFSTTDNTPANTVHRTGTVGVGCNISVLPFSTEFVCGEGLFRFNVQAAIQGRSIKRAVLRLWVDVPGADANTSFRVAAVAVPWNTFTVTFFSLHNGSEVYTSGQSTVPAPTTRAVPLEFDVTTIVRNWSNGTFLNSGLLVWDNVSTFPASSVLRAVYFESADSYTNLTRRPQLYIEFQ